MYISLFKTRDNQIVREHDTMEEALNVLNKRIDEWPPGSILRADVLEETEYLDDQFPDFDSCRLVASLRTFR